MWIQTRHIDSDLNRLLSRIRESDQTSVEERGVNPLFLALGFLEWYDIDSTSTPMYAPLVLLPQELNRDVKRGIYESRATTSGESAIANVALPPLVLRKSSAKPRTISANPR